MPAVIAWLVGRGLSSFVAWLIVGGLLTAAIGGVTYFAHHQWYTHISEPYRVEGDIRTTKLLQPRIDAEKKRADFQEHRAKVAEDFNKQLAEDIEGPEGLRAQVETAKGSITRWQTAAANAQSIAKRLLAQLAEQARREADALAKARAEAAGPALSFTEACQQADKTLTELAVWVRQ